MKVISLSDEEYEQLLDELRLLGSFQWNDCHTHANDCGSKVIGIIENQIAMQEGNE